MDRSCFSCLFIWGRKTSLKNCVKSFPNTKIAYPDSLKEKMFGWRGRKPANISTWIQKTFGNHFSAESIKTNKQNFFLNTFQFLISTNPCGKSRKFSKFSSKTTSSIILYLCSVVVIEELKSASLSCFHKVCL